MPEANVDGVVAEDLPKSYGILANLKEQADSLNTLAESLLSQVKSGNLTTSNGVSLLDVKYNYLLSYVTEITSCVGSKINGESLVDNPAIDRIVECRTTLEKVRPLEQKLKYQIDKILQGSSGATLHKDDPLQFKPNLDNFDSDSGTEGDATQEENKTGKYIPPHIASVMYDKEETGAKNEKAIERSKQRALNSSLISELVQESTDTPMEVSHHSNLKSKVRREQEDRNRFEEEYMTRVMVSKKQRSQERRNMQRSELDTISKFGNIGALEDVHETMAKKTSKGKGRINKKLKHKKRKFK